MRIRLRITLWIAITAMAAALGFAGFVFAGFVKEPGRLIDAELEHMARALVSRNLAADPGAGVDPARLPYPPDLYWIRVRDPSGRVIYRSPLARAVSIPERDGSRWYFETTVPRDRFQLGQDPDDGVAFRVDRIAVAVDGRDYRVMIAKPVEELEEDLHDLAREFSAGLAGFTIVLSLASYLVAGRILAPVGAIGRLAREINDRTLDRRIPVGDNRDELGELARTLNTMFDRLHESFRRQKRFLAAAAHEMKSPLALMILAQEELARRLAGTPELARDCRRQLMNMQRLKLLLNKLLDLSRLEAVERLDVVEMDVGAELAAVLDEYREFIDRRGITAEAVIEPGTMLAADRGMIRRLLINLVDNAVRYNRAGGRISAAARDEDGLVVVAIGNSGPGIPADELERVFEQFHRVEKSRSRDLGGSGLGLTIVRRIVELHRGRVEIASRQGEWTEVTVRLPVAGRDGLRSAG